MKNYLLPILFLFISCDKSKNSLITFSGNIKNNKNSVIKITNYNSTYKEEFPIDSAGNFNAEVLVNSDGYYFYKIGRPYTTVRFKKGKNVHVKIDTEDFYNSTVYSGELKVQNNYNVAKSKLRSSLVGDPKDYFVVPLNDFLEKIEKTKKSVMGLLATSGLSPEDKKLEKRIVEYDYLQSYNNYQKFYSYHKKVKAILPEDYYDPIINMDLDDDEMYRYSRAYRNLVIENYRHSSKIAMAEDSTLTIIDFVKNRISTIKSIDIKDQFSSMLIREMKEENHNLHDDYEKIMSLLVTEKRKEKLTQRYISAQETSSGKPAVEFNYENFSGGRTSLKDLKGSLLYIDVWATWCGPCIKEMPALKDLVAEYAGKNIEFVSISIDHKTDYEKWRKMVPEKNVGGVQLYDEEGLSSDFMKAFSVGLIPRIMMIDAEGKIISSNAPRPSSKEVRGFINGYLNQPKTMKFKTS